MTKKLMMTLKPQLRKIAFKKREHPIYHQSESPKNLFENK